MRIQNADSSKYPAVGGNWLSHSIRSIGARPAVRPAVRRRPAMLGLLMAAMLTYPVAAHAQQLVAPDADLMALDAVRVTASQTTPDAVPCGVDLRLALPVVEKQLQAGGVRATKSPNAVVTFSLMTTHNPASRLCATAVMLGAYRLVSYFDETAGWLKSGYVVLWQRGAQVLSSPNDHPLATERTLARLVENFLQTRREQHKPRAPSN